MAKKVTGYRNGNPVTRSVGESKLKPDTRITYPAFTHPDVLYWAPTWAMIRDCILGEQEIKARGELYLPRLDEMTTGEYNAYLGRSVFFNMVERTISSLTGVVFEKLPKISGIPTKLKKSAEKPTKNLISLNAFLKNSTAEVLTTGRYGVLVDMDANGKAAPYFVGYQAENILDWTIEEIDGRMRPTEIVLREYQEIKGVFGNSRKYTTVYRVLRLDTEDDGSRVYRQYIYRHDDLGIEVEALIPEIVTPTRNGVAFSEIPFRFIGAKTNDPSVDRSPISDIAALNLSHYRSYAQLEHGRYYTALPVYYAQVPIGSQNTDYRVGSAVVWECAPGEKPGIIEFTGTGLQSIENACSQKEDQISSLGGRLMGGRSRSVSESDNAVKMKEGNERSILLNIVMGLNEGMTDLLRFWVQWQGERGDDVSVELSTQFLSNDLGAREVRAVYAMYKDAVVPVEVLHFYLQKAEVVPDWLSVEEFKALLDSEESFPNSPDTWAKMRGFNTAKDERDYELTKEELDIADKEAGTKQAAVTETVRNNKVQATIQLKNANNQAGDANNAPGNTSGSPAPAQKPKVKGGKPGATTTN